MKKNVNKTKIVGNGDIAKVIKDMQINRRNFLFFASGVSNSSNNVPQSEYQREKDLLLSQDKSYHIVYFSSLSIFYANNNYQQHKKEMEKLIKDNFKKWTIVRIGNITWGNNPHTIINFFKNKIKNGEPFKIQDTYRYLVGKNEFIYWLNSIPNWNCELNLIGSRMKVKDIVKEIKENRL